MLDTEGALPKSYLKRHKKQTMVIKEQKATWWSEMYTDNLSRHSIFTDADLLRNRVRPEGSKRQNP